MLAKGYLQKDRQMELKDKILIHAELNTVWKNLNDEQTLKQCIPGCSELKGNPTDGFSATVTQKIGPVKATFRGNVTISDIIDKKNYTIKGEGKGGAAGFAKGEAKVELSQTDNGTEISYEVQAKVGGKIAQLGGRLINGFAKNLAKTFFENFKKRLEL